MDTLCEESRPTLVTRALEPWRLHGVLGGARHVLEGGSGAECEISHLHSRRGVGGGQATARAPLPLPSLSSSCSSLCFLMAQVLSCLWASDLPVVPMGQELGVQLGRVALAQGLP